ncbi:hypothetical protein EUGRSUZ_G00062 [Eucalyptus grandis]|uniref:Uncharacterized protein n=2 Tax=Eucalyptus grandis TaxID=71139 RepID=A0ACC3JZ43_EUCGR|nr:hypothetical protein EUGRSUZ_G00062 [Eucalyptus grandis]
MQSISLRTLVKEEGNRCLQRIQLQVSRESSLSLSGVLPSCFFYNKTSFISAHITSSRSPIASFAAARPPHLVLCFLVGMAESA